MSAKAGRGQDSAWAPLLPYLGSPRDGTRHAGPSRLARRAAREGRHPWRTGCEYPLDEPAPEVNKRPRGVRRAGTLFPLLLL